MAKRVFMTGGSTMVWTPAAQGAAAATLCFMEVKGGATTQVIDILEVLISGMATASTVAAMTVAYASTDAGTPTTLAAPGSDGPMMVNATALSSLVLCYIAGTTGPTPAASAALPGANATTGGTFPNQPGCEMPLPGSVVAERPSAETVAVPVISRRPVV